MGDVLIMNEIDATANRLGIDLLQVDLDSIQLPPGEDFGIIRYYLINCNFVLLVGQCNYGVVLAGMGSNLSESSFYYYFFNFWLLL